MSRARHKEERAKGGMAGVIDKDEMPKPYNAQGSHVEEEADEKASGGRAKRKRGGKAMEVEGEKEHKRLDRAERKRGGRAMGGNATANPMSSADKMTQAEGHKTETGNADGDGDRP